MKELQFGSKGTLVIRALSDFTLNGKDYVKDEIIYTVNEVDLNASPTQVSTSATTKYSVLNTSAFYADNLYFYAFNLDSELLNILFQNTQKTVLKFKEVVSTAAASLPEDGILDYKLYDENMKAVDKYDIKALTRYTKAFSKVESCYNFNSPNSRYYQIDFITRGKVAEENAKLTFHADKCSFIGVPQFIFNNDSNIQATMEFKIINNSSYFHIG